MLKTDALCGEWPRDGGAPPRYQLPPLPAYPDGAPSVLVVGGESGAGLAVCRALSLEHGFRVFLGAADRVEGNAAADAIEGDGGYCEPILCDADDADSCECAAITVESLLGFEPLSVVVDAASAFARDGGAYDCARVAARCKNVADALARVAPRATAPAARFVRVVSGAGPRYLAARSDGERAALTSVDATYGSIAAAAAAALKDPGGDRRGLSDACAAAASLVLARAHPELLCCTTVGGDVGVRAILGCVVGDRAGLALYGGDGRRIPPCDAEAPGAGAFDGPVAAPERAPAAFAAAAADAARRRLGDAAEDRAAAAAAARARLRVAAAAAADSARDAAFAAAGKRKIPPPKPIPSPDLVPPRCPLVTKEDAAGVAANAPSRTEAEAHLAMMADRERFAVAQAAFYKKLGRGKLMPPPPRPGRGARPPYVAAPSDVAAPPASYRHRPARTRENDMPGYEDEVDDSPEHVAELMAELTKLTSALGGAAGAQKRAAPPSPKKQQKPQKPQKLPELSGEPAAAPLEYATAHADARIAAAQGPPPAPPPEDVAAALSGIAALNDALGPSYGSVQPPESRDA